MFSPHFYWKRPEYPVRLAAGMNGRIMNCAPGGARLANKVFPVPRLIPRPSNPREPLAAGIGRGKFYRIQVSYLLPVRDKKEVEKIIVMVLY